MLIIIRSVNRYFAASDEDDLRLDCLRSFAISQKPDSPLEHHQNLRRHQIEIQKVKMKIILALISLLVAQTVEKDADYEAELAAFEAEIAKVEARELAEFLGLTTLR